MAGDRSFFELGQKIFLQSHFIIKEQQNHLGDHEFSQKWYLACILVHPNIHDGRSIVVDDEGMEIVQPSAFWPNSEQLPYRLRREFV